MLKEKKVLLDDDDSATGPTIKFCKELMLKRGASMVKSLVMFSRTGKHVDYVASDSKKYMLDDHFLEVTAKFNFI